MTAREIFERALGLDAAERGAYVEMACGERGEVLDEVRRMLEDAARVGSGWSGLDAATLVDGVVARGEDGMGGTERAGDWIGPYLLEVPIGEGGFGMVWQAEQRVPMVRKVALKVIKAGMDTREVLARFEAERQALAMMDHPNIAMVLDAGATVTGRPYFAMELVKGIPITHYCDGAGLGTRERLALFGDVCAAIQHAHQKGVIHRDIKPSNVMVTMYGEKPVVKVIDFGIAKATQGKLTERTLFTQMDQFIGTPAYMSPEQANLSGVDIDTRSDIYAMGVLLYELLTGRPPFDPRTLLSAGYDEMRRIIREVEPPRPSSRLSTVMGVERTELARTRQMDPERLKKLIEPDLDWIVMKAIEKDRERRYETADGFAEDIRRLLADEPVSARPPSAGYQLRKFAKRHRVALRVAAGIAVVLVVASAFSIWQAVRATRERDDKEAARREAVRESAKRTQVARFLTEMLEGVGPSVARGRDTTILREILDRTAARLAVELSEQPAVESEIRQTLGSVYRQIGDYPKAEEMLRGSVALRRKEVGGASGEIAGPLHELALVLSQSGDLPGAEAMMREGLAMRLGLFGREHPAVATSINDIGVVLRDRGDLVGAAAMFGEALDLRRRTLGGEHRDVAASLHNLAVVQDARGDVGGAAASFREVIEVLKKLHGGDHPDVATAIHSLGATLMNSGDAAGAAEKFGEALAMQRRLFPDGHPDIATTLLNRAGLMMEEGDLGGAEPVLREVLGLQRRFLGAEHPEMASTMVLLSRVIKDGGDPAGGEAMCREAIAMQRKLLGAEHVAIATSLDVLSGFASDRGAMEEAETTSREALAMFRKLLPAEDPGITASLHNLTGMLVAQNKTAEVGVLVREVVEEAGRAPAAAVPKFEERMALIGEALHHAGQPIPAEVLCRERLRSVRSRLDPGDEAVQEAMVSLASLLSDWAWSETAAADRSKALGRAREAEPLLRECLAVRGRTLRPESSRLADTRSRLGGVMVVDCVLDASLTSEARTARLKEAEQLLLRSHEVLGKAGGAGAMQQQCALTNLVNLYLAWDLPDKAAEWKDVLRDFEQGITR